jgi:hypothetical protein
MAEIAIGEDVGLEKNKPVLVHTGWHGNIPLIKTMYVVDWGEEADTVKVAYPRPSREKSIWIRRSQIMDTPSGLTRDQEMLRPLQLSNN